MRLLSQTEVVDKRRKDEEIWRQRISTLERTYNSLEEKVRLANTDLTPLKRKKVEEYNAFLKDLQKKREEKLLELQDITKKKEMIEDIIDGVSQREDMLNDLETSLKEKARVLREREMFILAGERRMLVT